jgi:hypothetical protein
MKIAANVTSSNPVAAYKCTNINMQTYAYNPRKVS